MAAKKAPKPAVKPAPKPETPATETRADSKPEPTKADEKRLVRDVELAEKEVDQARALVKEAEGKLSFAIKAISDAFGSGPFEIRGKRVNISSRNETYFFKGEKQSVRQLG